MLTVRQLLGMKKAEVFAVGVDAAVIDAVRLMAEKSIGAVLVMQGQRLVGIVSERDYARKVVLKDRASSRTRVGEIMTAEVVTVRPDESVATCMQLMTERRFRHLPVVEDGQVKGVISIGDLVKAVIEEQARDIDQLQRYIAG
ncbi:MAG TPA: CBS domain-containing protein [Stenotrophomonas sp.]|nr:CBS domain-containing protein [Stenotrophomonas sp.]